MQSRQQLGAGRQVTVIVTDFGCQDLLSRALDSIVAQTFDDWALVVVDDHNPSADHYGTLCDHYRDYPLSWLRTTANVGQFRIYNRLLPLITSPFVALQDADDWSAPQRLATLFTALTNQRADIIGSAAVRVDAERRVLGYRTPPADVNRALRFRRRGGVIVGPTIMAKTAFLRELGGFDGTTRIGGDTELISRAVFRGRVRNLSEPLYYHTEREGSLTQSAATGFGSPLRTRYTRRLNRRLHVNVLRKLLGGPTRQQLTAPANDMHFELRQVG